MHFDAQADDYDRARPPYPPVLHDTLVEVGASGPGRDVLEVGAGTGLATRELVARGSRVVALEPGAHLAGLLRRAVPQAEVVVSTLEDADLPAAGFDAAVAATSLHWVDLAVGLPLLHRALRPGGRLAVFRHVFADPSRPPTDFRRRIAEVVARRPGADTGPYVPVPRPTAAELVVGGWFVHERSEDWGWSIDLDTPAAGRLFASFSDWSGAEVAEVEQAVDELGGQVTEHYRTTLHVLRRA